MLRTQDCIRDLDYFKANAIWHQAAHDMIGDNGPRGSVEGEEEEEEEGEEERIAKAWQRHEPGSRGCW